MFREVAKSLSRQNRLLYGNKKGLVAGHGVLRGFSPKLMGKKGIGVDYHPGAVKFFKEAGIW